MSVNILDTDKSVTFKLHQAEDDSPQHVDVTYPEGFGFIVNEDELWFRYEKHGFAEPCREGEERELDLFNDDCVIIGRIPLLSNCDGSYAMSLKLAMDVYLEITKQKEVTVESGVPTSMDVCF